MNERNVLINQSMKCEHLCISAVDQWNHLCLVGRKIKLTSFGTKKSLTAYSTSGLTLKILLLKHVFKIFKKWSSLGERLVEYEGCGKISYPKSVHFSSIFIYPFHLICRLRETVAIPTPSGGNISMTLWRRILFNNCF